MKLRFLYEAYHPNKMIVQHHQMQSDFTLGTEIQGIFSSCVKSLPNCSVVRYLS